MKKIKALLFVTIFLLVCWTIEFLITFDVIKFKNPEDLLDFKESSFWAFAKETYRELAG